ncbi:ATP-binding protein [Pirellulaceae bacterium SH449]
MITQPIAHENNALGLSACPKGIRTLGWVLAAALTVFGPVSLAYSVEQSSNEPVPPKRVLILYSHRQAVPVTLQWDRGIRSAIAENYRKPLAIDVEYLDAERLEDPTLKELWVDLLRGKYELLQPDLVIPVHDVSAAIYLRNYQKLFPNTSVVFCSIEDRLRAELPITTKMTGVSYRLDYHRTMECALRLFPRTRRVVVVSGTGIMDRGLLAEFQMLFSAQEHPEIEYWTGVPEDVLYEDTKQLSNDSIVFYLAQDRDRNGRPSITPLNVVQRISSAAKVPVFGLYDTLLDHGIMGGCLAPVEAQGRLAGQLAARILNGESPSDIPLDGVEMNQFMFDHRQLSRWGIRERDLPEGSRIMFKEPGIWQQYGVYLSAGIAILGLQMLLIVTLLVNRSRRVVAENFLAERLRFESLLSELSSRFVNAPQAKLSSEIEFALNRVLELSGLELGVLFELDQDGLRLRKLVSVVRSGEITEITKFDEVALDSIPWLWSQVKSGRSITFSDLSTLPDLATCEKVFFEHVGLKAAMASSLHALGSPFAVIVFGQLTGEYDWNETVVKHLEALTEVLKIALAQARSEVELETSRKNAQQLAGRLLTAIEDERRYLAREMHDDLTQRLALAALEANKIEQRLDQETARVELKKLREGLIAISDDVHRISRRLHPSILNDLGLPDAIRSECNRISEQEVITVEFHSVRYPQQVPKDLELCLYRVAQEAMRNAEKHSRTKRIQVTLNADAESLYLSIRDFGCGFAPGASGGLSGLGIASMEERVRLVDGSLAINSVVGEGTSILVAIPLLLC